MLCSSYIYPSICLGKCKLKHEGKISGFVSIAGSINTVAHILKTSADFCVGERPIANIYYETLSQGIYYRAVSELAWQGIPFLRRMSLAHFFRMHLEKHCLGVKCVCWEGLSLLVLDNYPYCVHNSESGYKIVLNESIHLINESHLCSCHLKGHAPVLNAKMYLFKFKQIPACLL